MLKAKIYKARPEATLPQKGSPYSAGYDVTACLGDVSSVDIPPHSSVLITTGLIVEPPLGYWAGVFARSGLALKQGLRPGNCVGVVDNDYRGEYKVIMHNDSDEVRTIKNGERIAQIIFIPQVDCDFEEVDSADALAVTDRGEGGFGSTGA